MCQLWRIKNYGIRLTLISKREAEGEGSKVKEPSGPPQKSYFMSKVWQTNGGKERGGRQKLVYYHCSRYHQPWAKEPCNYRRFIPWTWEGLVWQDVCAWLRDDAWVEQQLVSEQDRDNNMEKLIRLQQLIISQTNAKIANVQEGFDGGVYTVEQAKKRIANYQEIIAKAEREIQRLRENMKA
jgi:hypothetical protein